MADEDPREMVRFHSPETHWKSVREERKRDAEKDKTEVPSDVNKAFGQEEEPFKQGLSPSGNCKMYLPIFLGHAVASSHN